MVTQRMLAGVIVLLGLVLVISEALPRTIFDVRETLRSQVESPSVPSTIVPASSPPSGDETATEATHASRSDETAFVGVIRLVGVVSLGNRWQVALKEYSTGETRFVQEGERVFGYRVKRITRRGVVLQGAGQEFVLRIGDYRSPTGSDLPYQLAPVQDNTSNSPIAELARMEGAERQLWVAQWMDGLSPLMPEEQEAARAQMRDYWRQQWEGEWGSALRSEMTLEQQENVRREISSYWRW